MARNPVMRVRHEQPSQVLMFLGGAGGSGKTQVIKAFTYLHERLHIKHTLHLTAYTGTAAAHIQGSTLSSLGQIGHNRNQNLQKLEATWAHINTIVLDEVSMVGCRLLGKTHRSLMLAKHKEKNLPFAGIDILFAGKFSFQLHTYIWCFIGLINMYERINIRPILVITCKAHSSYYM